jgi:hypothetical protein
MTKRTKHPDERDTPRAGAQLFLNKEALRDLAPVDASAIRGGVTFVRA